MKIIEQAIAKALDGASNEECVKVLADFLPNILADCKHILEDEIG